MNLNLGNKHALVNGGSKGIGFASAVELALLGADITLVARNIDSLAEAIRHLPKTHANQNHDFMVLDLSHIEDVNKKMKALVLNKSVHILINNTGGPASGNILNASPEEFLAAFNQHLISNQVITSNVVPGMKKSQYGRIINIISTSVKAPLKGLGVSNTIRAAVANWSKTLAGELAPFGITVNNVLPGATATERLQEIILNKSSKSGRPVESVEQEMLGEIPMARFGKSEEIAAAVAFLASPASSYVTGTNITIDGGRTTCL